MFKKRVVVSLLMSIALLIGAAVSFATVASPGHTNSFSAIDGGEIRYGGGTKYFLPFNSALSQWNSLGKVNIAPDTIWVIEDLTFTDMYSSLVPWAGLYSYDNLYADTIQYNDYYLQVSSDSIIRNTVIHEIGHALGIMDHYYPWDYIVMHGHITGTTSLTSHDITDYHIANP